MLCPYCRSDIPAGALRCGACTSWIPDRSPAREWRRARQNRMVAGVCQGLANHYGLPVTAVRLVAIVTTIFGFWGLPVYLVLWVLMPLEPELPSAEPVQPHATVP